MGPPRGTPVQIDQPQEREIAGLGGNTPGDLARNYRRHQGEKDNRDPAQLRGPHVVVSGHEAIREGSCGTRKGDAAMISSSLWRLVRVSFCKLDLEAARQSRLTLARLCSLAHPLLRSGTREMTFLGFGFSRELRRRVWE